MIYPACGIEFDLSSCHENARAPMLSRDALSIYWNHCLGGGLTRVDCYAAPMPARSFRHPPPVFTTTAQYDPVRDDGRFYGECLRYTGNTVVYRNALRLIHGWLRPRHVSVDASLEFEVLCSFLQ